MLKVEYFSQYSTWVFGRILNLCEPGGDKRAGIQRKIFPLFFYIRWIYYLPNYIYDIEFELISISCLYSNNWKLIEKEKTVCKVSYEKCYNHNFRTIFIGLWSLELVSWREARLYLTFQGKFIQHDDSIKKKTNKKLHFWTLKS